MVKVQKLIFFLGGGGGGGGCLIAKFGNLFVACMIFLEGGR